QSYFGRFPPLGRLYFCGHRKCLSFIFIAAASTGFFLINDRGFPYGFIRHYDFQCSQSQCGSLGDFCLAF
ncbi:MAG: hypothetical protein ACPHSB_07440, partial [Flavobacteriaceae bacterium]